MVRGMQTFGFYGLGLGVLQRCYYYCINITAITIITIIVPTVIIITISQIAT